MLDIVHTTSLGAALSSRAVTNSLTALAVILTCAESISVRNTMCLSEASTKVREDSSGLEVLGVQSNDSGKVGSMSVDKRNDRGSRSESGGEMHVEEVFQSYYGIIGYGCKWF